MLDIVLANIMKSSVTQAAFANRVFAPEKFMKTARNIAEVIVFETCLFSNLFGASKEFTFIFLNAPQIILVLAFCFLAICQVESQQFRLYFVIKNSFTIM